MTADVLLDHPSSAVLPPNWMVRRFGDLLESGTRNGIYKPKEYHGRGVKIVNMGELFANPRLHSVPMKRVSLDESEMARFTLHPGDLLFARRSLVAEGAGKCSIVLDVDEPTTFESSIIRARPDPARAYSLFLYYLFNGPYGRHALMSIRRQVAVSGITGSDLVQLPLPVPPLKDQVVIGDALGTLDEKIELNHQMNRVLTSLARATFKTWFSDFEPVKMKAAGSHSFPGMPQEVFDQLPAGLIETELGLIPAGWQHVRIGDLVRVVGGATPSTSNSSFWAGGTYAFCTPKDMSGLTSPILLDTERHITQAGVEKISSGQLPPGAVLLSSRAPIGYLAVAQTPVSVNQGIIAMVSDSIPSTYVLLWAEANLATIESRAGGSTFAEINKRTFREIPALKPDSPSLKAFDQITQPLFQKIVSNERESQMLGELRDTMLPRLVSGETILHGQSE